MAVFNLLNLPAYLVVHGLLHELEAIEVLNLAACAKFCTGFAHGHIGIAAKTAFLHVAVANTNPGDDFVQLFGVSHSLGARAHVGFRDNFKQRRAGPVQVDAAHANEVFVQRFAGIFFKVGTHQSNRFFLAFQKKLDAAALHHRNFKLTDLVALG